MLMLFVGYLLVFFHIKMNGIDILPDFVGYILIFMGLRRLTPHSAHFAKARPLSVAMAALSFLAAAGQVLQLDFSGGFFHLLNLVTIALSLVILWLIIEGIRDTERQLGADMGSRRLSITWKVLTVLDVLYSILMLAPLPSMDVVIAFLVCAVFAANVVLLVFLYFARGVYDSTPKE